MTTNDRLSAIETRLDALERQSKEIDYIENKLIDAARQYARCVSLGFFIDDKGFRVRAGKHDIDSLYAPHYLEEMKRAACDIIREEASR